MYDTLKQEIYETQDYIIRKQSKIIYQLFSLLSQYMTAEELDGLDVIKQINNIANIR